MGELRFVEEKTPCELCGKAIYQGTEIIYGEEQFWACMACGEKAERLKAKEAEKNMPLWVKEHKIKAKDLKRKLKI